MYLYRSTSVVKGTCITFILEGVSRTNGNSHLDCNEMGSGIMVRVPQIHNKPMLNCVNKRNQKLFLLVLNSFKGIGLSYFGVFSNFRTNDLSVFKSVVIKSGKYRPTTI